MLNILPVNFILLLHSCHAGSPKMMTDDGDGQGDCNQYSLNRFKSACHSSMENTVTKSLPVFLLCMCSDLVLWSFFTCHTHTAAKQNFSSCPCTPADKNKLAHRGWQKNARWVPLSGEPKWSHVWACSLDSETLQREAGPSVADGEANRAGSRFPGKKVALRKELIPTSNRTFGRNCYCCLSTRLFFSSGRPLLLLLAQEKTLSFSVHWCTPGTTAALPLSCLCLAYLVLKKLCLHLPSTGHTPSPRIPGHKFLQHQFCFRIFVRVWVLFCLVFFCGLLFFWFFFLAKCRLTFQGNVCCSINFFSTCLLK